MIEIMGNYKGIYNAKSRRLKDWDYRSNGFYFITICTKNKKCIFGNISEDKMLLSDEGCLAEIYFKEINHRYSFAKLDNFVVMPNHIHVILIMNESSNQNAMYRAPTNKSGGFAGNKNPMLNNNVSKIIRWYKGRVTFEIRKTNPNFSWQTNYYDHIIRNEKSYQEIHDYISNNPLKWSLDRFNPMNGINM